MASCSFNFSASPTLGILCNVSLCILIKTKHQQQHFQIKFCRNITGASRSTRSSPYWWANNRWTTFFHRELWLRKLFNSPITRDPLRFWVIHSLHPPSHQATTAGCMWGVVDGKTNLHRLPHTQCDVWSVGTRHIHQRAPWRWRPRCHQHGRARHLHRPQHDHLFPPVRF